MPEIRVFTIFLQVCISLVFLDIGQDCNLRQCPSSTRAETSKKNCGSTEDLTGLN